MRDTHPTAPSYVHAERVPLGSASISKVEKIKKHRAAAENKGDVFSTLVVETFDGISKVMCWLVKLIAWFAVDNKGFVRRSVFHRKFVSEVSITLQYEFFLTSPKALFVESVSCFCEA